MAGEWAKTRIQDIAKRTATGPFGSAISAKNFVGSGVPVIRGSNLSQSVSTRLDDSGLIFDSKEKAREFSRSEVRQGDLVFTCWGTIDQVGLIDSRAKYDRYIVSNKQMLLTPDETKADSLFLYYYFASPETRAKILNQGIGSSVPGFNLGQLRSFEVSLPPLPIQKAIAAILGSLDDKIDLNRRMNATLEAMARALFQSWFVDFDPVRAKRDGRQPPGLDSDTAALFPDSFQDAEIGRIPTGWDVVSLDALASIRGGKQLPTEDCLDFGEFTVFGANGIMGYTKDFTHDGFVIAFGRVGAYCGSIHWSLKGAWINNNASAVVPMQWPVFVLQTMLNIDFSSMRTGSAQPFIPNSSLASAKVVRPSPPIAEAFCNIVEPFRRQQADNDHHPRPLTTLRDTLLPKLLSGEIRVSEAERHV